MWTPSQYAPLPNSPARPRLLQPRNKRRHRICKLRTYLPLTPTFVSLSDEQEQRPWLASGPHCITEATRQSSLNVVLPDSSAGRSGSVNHPTHARVEVTGLCPSALLQPIGAARSYAGGKLRRRSRRECVIVEPVRSGLEKVWPGGK